MTKSPSADRARSAIFVGDGSLLVTCAEIFLAAGHCIAGVSSSLNANLEWSDSKGIPLLGPVMGLDLSGHEFDYLFSVANLEILPDEMIDAAKVLAVNFHDGPLPRYAGLNTPAWALMNGETSYGITWHEMVPKIDAGRIIRQERIDISSHETAYSLNTKCYAAAVEAFRAIVEGLTADRLVLTEQDGERTIYTKSRRPERFGFIDFDQPADAVERLVRALDYGAYEHPLGRAKIWTADGPIIVSGASVSSGADGFAPGTILSARSDSLTIATGKGCIAFSGLMDGDGRPLLDGDFLPGRAELLPLDADIYGRIQEHAAAVARAQDYWFAVLKAAAPAEIPYPRKKDTDASDKEAVIRIDLPNLWDEPSALIGGLAAWLSLLAGQSRISLALEGVSFLNADHFVSGMCRRDVLITVPVDPEADAADLAITVECDLTAIRTRAPIACDAIACLANEGVRATARDAFETGVFQGEGIPSNRLLLLHINDKSRTLCLQVRASAFSRPVAETMANHLAFFLRHFLDASAGAIGKLPLVPDDERDVFARLNRTQRPFDEDGVIDRAIAVKAGQIPDQRAVECGDVVLTYAELEAKAAMFAHALNERGAGPGSVVGLCMRRTPDLIVALLGILKSGAAYLPLDPDYPQDRISLMLEDSGAQLIAADARCVEQLHLDPVRVAMIGGDDSEASKVTEISGRSSDDLAYLIYTSGSTGKPKGVMVTHRNVLNFFTAMDECVPHEEGGRFLAVTSPSFDISVLELCWTLARGFTVVLQAGDMTRSNKGPGFSLFYFSSDADARGRGAYKLLFEGAKFADANGFEAVWTPERHFHSFGGLFPNPAVAGAAIAAITERIHVRAGSCVLPLHHPVRAAEEWALVDNLCDGRAGMALASGWQPNDFIIRPDAFEARKQVMVDGIGQLRRLWKGEKVAFPNHTGKMVDVSTLPRPVNDDIPLWITAAGSPETFEIAGQHGCNVLTHLLGQTFEEIGEKIRIYRSARAKAGYRGHGRVTLMLHTFVGDDPDHVEEVVREPMKNYLRSAVDLVKKASWSFPTFVQRGEEKDRTPAQIFEEEDLTEEESEALLEHAFQRYYRTSGLFGTPEHCADIVRKSVEIGVDEIACLIDFGVDKETTLAHLPHIRKVMDLIEASGVSGTKASLAEDILKEEITHFQCTPSMASILVADEAGRTALGKLDVTLVGGEALPLPLARDLRRHVSGKLLNMYGPTETTIWSAVQDLSEISDFVPLGSPVANTSIHVVNKAGGECPSLVPGEILIGGDGVTNGYWCRENLTRDRFIPDAFSDDPQARLYRTGDLARRRADGAFEFLGRMDHQVKIRGHRIELGEIETVLADHPSVREAVAKIWDEPGGPRLAGYVVPAQGAKIDIEALNRFVAERLPEIMRPSVLVSLPKLPQTPNGKIDRNALPAVTDAQPKEREASANDLEASIAAIWCEMLGLPAVSMTDNFFDLGGHSLLVVQVQRCIKQELGLEVPITEMFRFTTIRSLANYLQEGGNRESTGARRGQDRASIRRRRMAGVRQNA